METSINIKKIFFVVLIAMIFGLFILIYCGFAVRWIVSFSIALIILFLGISLKNPKHFFLSLFFLSLPVVTSNYIGRLSRLHYGGPAGFYNTFYDFPLLMLYLFWIPQIFITKTAKVRFSKLDLCMLGLIGMSFLSIYNAVDRQLCLYEISRLIIMYLIFFYMANGVTSKRDLRFIIIPLLIGLFLESLLGIFQYYSGQVFSLQLIGEREDIISFHAISRIGGTLGHPNTFARYLGLFISLPISLLFATIKGRYKILCGLMFLAAVLALIITFCRTAWVGFVISMAVLVVLGLKAKLFDLPRALFVVIIGIIILTVVVFIFQDAIFTRIFSSDYGSAFSRIPLMKVATNIIKAHPFLGIGINNYAEVMQNYDNTVEGISFTFHNVVHNSYLLIAAEIGMGGLFLFLWFVIHLYKKVLKIMSCNDRFIICFTIGVVAGFTSLLIQLMVMPPTLVSTSFLFFWTMSGLIVAVSRLSETAKT